MQAHMRRRILLVRAGLALSLAGTARAGPPFVTDDPEPVDLGHWEVYGFSAGTHAQGNMSGVLSGVQPTAEGGRSGRATKRPQRQA